MELKPAYKQTEVGVIPTDWKIESIAQLLDDNTIIGHLDGNHGELYPRSSEFKEYGLPYIGANDFESGMVAFNRCKFLSKERASQFRKGIAKDGDVLFAHNATVGPVALLRTKEEFVILSTTATYFRCNSEKLDNHYLKSALQSAYFVTQYRAVMSQSTRFQVPITAQRKFILIIPPIPEQRAIAVALNDVDDLINSQDSLIAKKRNIKQVAMQQLLTGKQRLPGFSGEWEEKQLGDIADLKNGYAFKSETYSPLGSYKIVTITNVQDGFMDTRECKKIINLPHDLQPHHKLVRGDLLISMTGNVGRVCKVNDENCLLNQRVGKLIARASKTLLFYLLAQRIFILTMTDKATGGAQGNLSVSDILGYKFRLPKDPEEQTAIAKVLSDMDAEITALETQRDKTKLLKQGMMQELLTGRIRLV